MKRRGLPPKLKAAAARAGLPPLRAASKYGNEKVDGYDSKHEARRAWTLKALERSGEITDLQEQVKFELIPAQAGERAAHYIADFVYRRDGVQVVEDAKGHRTAEYRLKRKLMLFRHGIRIQEV